MNEKEQHHIQKVPWLLHHESDHGRSRFHTVQVHEWRQVSQWFHEWRFILPPHQCSCWLWLSFYSDYHPPVSASGCNSDRPSNDTSATAVSLQGASLHSGNLFYQRPRDKRYCYRARQRLQISWCSQLTTRLVTKVFQQGSCGHRLTVWYDYKARFLSFERVTRGATVTCSVHRVFL